MLSGCHGGRIKCSSFYSEIWFITRPSGRHCYIHVPFKVLISIDELKRRSWNDILTIFHAWSGPGLEYFRSLHNGDVGLWINNERLTEILTQSRMCLYNRFISFCPRWLNWNKSRVWTRYHILFSFRCLANIKTKGVGSRNLFGRFGSQTATRNKSVSAG